METTVHALLTMAAVSPDTAAIVLLGALPLLMSGTLVLLLLPGPPPGPSWQERERHLDPRPARWVPAHRATSPRPPRGRHEPGRGRYRTMARQAQLEEHTVTAARFGD